MTSGTTLRFIPVTLKYGDYTFTARGFSAAAAGSGVLYKTSQTVGVTKTTTNVALVMTRITSNLIVNASGVAAGEAVVATSGGVAQALRNSGDGTATGTLSGVATGNQVFVVVEAKNALGAVVKQGQSATIALSETHKTVSVVLNAVGAGNQLPDSVALSVVPVAPVAGSSLTLNIVATDPDGADDLTFALINWMDGGDLQSQPLTGGAASPTHTYAVAGSYTVSVTVYDRAGTSKSEAVTVVVAQQETGSTGGNDAITFAPAQPLEPLNKTNVPDHKKVWFGTFAKHPRDSKLQTAYSNISATGKRQPGTVSPPSATSASVRTVISVRLR